MLKDAEPVWTSPAKYHFKSPLSNSQGSGAAYPVLPDERPSAAIARRLIGFQIE
jgi:hypothetical protein